MSREITLFTDYKGEENIITNYCGLILKLLYEENPDSFEEVIVGLIEDEINLIVGPKFTQQKREETSIPDLVIEQSSFEIKFESKLGSFNKSQLINHINNMTKNMTKKDKILFGLSIEKSTTESLRDIKKIAKENDIYFKYITFEELVETLENVPSSERYKSLLEEFKLFLDRNGKLPKWKYRLDVVNCSKSKEDVLKNEAYICPDTGGPYSHRRAKYLGVYKEKIVSWIFEITAVVSVGIKMEENSIKWKNIEINDKKIMKMTEDVLTKRRIEENKNKSLQVFLLRDGHETNFKKERSGSLWGSKIYFYEIAKDCENSKELAKKLEGKIWEDFK